MSKYNKEKLFELVRREEVVIWAGAGLSLYAGYPSGKKLTEILYNSLSKSEKRQIRKSQALPDFAEDFVKLKNDTRHELVRILDNTFVETTPKTIECHDKLVSIPHIKTIITTNYDRLFEEAYKGKGHVVISPKKIPFIDSKRVQIFKVHGDLVDPGSIIITKSDYLRFFSNDSEYNDLWTTIKTILLTKNIVFLGYGIEDPNIEVILNRIGDSLGAHKRECFFVAPSIKHTKRNDLLKRGISYVNSNAQDLIDELIDDIKANIISDQQNGKVSAETCGKFLLDHKLYFEISPQNNKLNIGSIRGIDRSVNSRLNLTFNSSPDLINEFNDFIIGKKVGEIELDGKDIVKTDFNIGGIKIPSFDNAKKIVLKSAPNKTVSIDLKFENGYDFENLEVDVYGKTPYYELHCKLKTTTFTVKADFSEKKGAKVDFTYQHNEVCSKLNEEINELTLIYNLFSGAPFKLYWNDTTDFFKPTIPFQKEQTEYATFFMEYFESLKLVENHFNVRFQKIKMDEITKGTKSIIDDLVRIINKKEIKADWDGTCTGGLYDASKETIEALEEINEGKQECGILACVSKKTKVKLHGQIIALGYSKVLIEKPYILNLQEIIKLQTKDMKAVSRNQTVSITYTETPQENQFYIVTPD